jgi:AraC-like DNA-binding protein/quercetin dioxygenase-like cupin family protein
MLYSDITLGTVLRSAAGSAARLIETTHDAHSHLGWHEHEDLSLDVVLDGTFREDVDGEQLTRFAGSMVLKPSGIGHRNAYGPSGTRTLIVHIPPTSPLLEAALVDGKRSDGPLAVDEAVIATLRALAPPHAQRFSTDQLRRMRARVLDGRGAHNLTAVAREFGLSPSAFTHAFRARFGCTPRVMLRRHRLETACAMLRTSRTPIAVVAAEAGFADQAHLTRECRCVLGVTPREYRRCLTGRAIQKGSGTQCAGRVR